MKRRNPPKPPVTMRRRYQLQPPVVSLYRTILQNIICGRYMDENDIHRAIDMAFEANRLSTRESRLLEAAAFQQAKLVERFQERV